jgi:hypothetical protein
MRTQSPTEFTRINGSRRLGAAARASGSLSLTPSQAAGIQGRGAGLRGGPAAAGDTGPQAAAAGAAAAAPGHSAAALATPSDL